MHQIGSHQYFLLIPEINLYPEIHTNTILMLEQVMNALILTNKQNIQHGINLVINLEKYCKSLTNENYLIVLKKIENILKESNIYIAQGEEVRAMYPKYHKQKYYWDVGKQAAINLEFALEKKLSFDGVNIIWEPTYIDWIYELVKECRENCSYNLNDTLLYNRIVPKVLDNFIETREIILKETQKYTEYYRQILEDK